MQSILRRATHQIKMEDTPSDEDLAKKGPNKEETVRDRAKRSEEDSEEDSDDDASVAESRIQLVEAEDDENLLTEDAYSLLYTASICSPTALFAWFSITLQGGMLLVTFLDLFDTGSDPSKLVCWAGLA